MITKITVDFPRIRSYYKNQNAGEYGHKDFFTGHKELQELQNVYHRSSLLVLYAGQFPETTIKDLVEHTFGSDSFKKVWTTQRTKTKRTHRIGFLIIHEEDTVQVLKAV